jgi:tRNA-specific 2-thiouridylase
MLRKGIDPGKDQSYFLYDLTQEQLSRTLFPLGGLTKPEVREIAESQGLVTAKKRESQDICFVPDGDYASFICGYTGHDYPPGDFVSRDGTVMGTHKGIINYTIGQRKGLGLALKKPAYVLNIDTEQNRVILGDNEDLFTRELTAESFNWVSTEMPQSGMRASARIRYRHHEAPATIIPLSETSAKIIFDEPQRAITRGQSVVVYDGDYVLGGGIIL